MSTTRIDERARLVFHFRDGGSATFRNIRIKALPAEVFTTAMGIGQFQSRPSNRVTRVDEHEILKQV